MVWALLPLKDFVSAKQRLAGVLASHERRRLFHAMVEDVLDVLSVHPSITRTVIVSDDPSAQLLAEHYGVSCWPETPLQAQGLSAVVAAAARRLVAEGAEAMLVVHGDLPLLNTVELQTLLDSHRASAAPALTIAPDSVGNGSNCLVCSPPDAIQFCYGEGSFERHRAAASAAGINFNALPLPGLGCDIDTPADLQTLLATPEPHGHALRYVHDSGIAERLRAMAIGEHRADSKKVAAIKNTSAADIASGSTHSSERDEAL